jgi:hypothetical protein
MSAEKNLEVNNAVNELAMLVAKAQNLIAKGHNYDSSELYDAAINIMTKADIFVGQLEEMDENMDIEKTNIPSLDDLFEGNPVTDYVDARINLAMGDDSEENINAMKSAAEAINELYEEEELHGLYEESALHQCGCEPGDACSSCPEDDICFEDCTPTSCTCEEYSLLEYISAVDNSVTGEINETLSLIEQLLGHADSFSEDDVKILRFYMSHLPSCSFNDIEELSDRAVELAFKTRMINLGIKK